MNQFYKVDKAKVRGVQRTIFEIARHLMLMIRELPEYSGAELRQSHIGVNECYEVFLLDHQKRRSGETDALISVTYDANSKNKNEPIIDVYTICNDFHLVKRTKTFLEKEVQRRFRLNDYTN